MKSVMHTTDWIPTEDYGKVRFQWGYSYISGNQDAYVSITQEQRHGDFGFSSGTAELAEQWAPSLAPLCRWHLCGVNTGPLHYIPNAEYWWDVVHGRDKERSWYREDDVSNKPPEEAREILMNHIVYGAVDTDWMYDPVQMTREDFVDWLIKRRPALVEQLRKDCDPIVLG